VVVGIGSLVALLIPKKRRPAEEVSLESERLAVEAA
jgi:hypothetical protein